MQKDGQFLPVCHEPQGESVAIQMTEDGFYTVSEAKGEKNATEINVPIYFYSLLVAKSPTD